MDKKVFNVDKNLTQVGGSAVDILNQVPSVTVDLEGNVNLRGSQDVNVFIDGKPSALMGINPSAALEQIPAASIERIEIITNPSAKYDAEGMAGIINIVLKKNTQAGINGTATGGIGTGEKYNGGASLNYQDKKVNVYTNYNYRNQQREGTGDSYRNTFFPDTSFSLLQESTQQNHNISHALRTGAEVTLDPNNTLGLTATFNKSKREETETIRNREMDENGVQTRLYDRSSTSDQNSRGMDYALNYKRQFQDGKRNFTTDLSYSSSESNSYRYFSDLDYLDDNTPASIPAVLQNTLDRNDTKVFNYQSDYSAPVNADKDKLETGVKWTHRSIGSDFSSETYDYNDAAWQSDTLLENNFDYLDDVLAGYAIYSKDLHSVKIKAGLRSEYTAYRIDQLTQVSTYKNNYLKFFPSVFVSKTVANGTDLQLSYSKRINRPSLNALNPIADYSDPQNIRQGNPYLEPEIIHSMELSTVRYRDKLTLNGTLYYRYIVDQIQRYRTVDSNGVATMTQENLDNGSSYGAEASARWQIINSWDLMLSGNIYQSEMNAQNLEENLSRTTLGGSSKLISNVRFPADFNFQVTGEYSSGGASVIGEMKPNLSFDMGLRKDFFSRNLSTNLSVTDIFNARKFSMVLDGSNYHQEFTRKRESRVLTLNVTWKFGRQADSQNKGKRQKEKDQQSTPGEMQDDF
jgi:outer membrane receptor protein involved in Fe transport